MLSRCLLALALVPAAAAWWNDLPAKDRGDPPYPYPASRHYNTVNEKDGPVEGKINVHLVPHTHDDTGWQVTVDQYFFDEVYYVVDTVVDQLLKDPKRHFIYVETGFFARWWDEQPDARRNATKALVAGGQLEFINGGWCMHDEASPYYVEMVDQTTRGHQFLKKNFGNSGIPRGTWQIDPFGHSNTEAWLLGAEAGMESLFWGRTDYQDLDWRKSPAGQANNQWPEWVWQGSQSLGKSAEVFAGELTSGGYGAPIGWDGQGGAIQDNPSRHDYNLDSMVDSFIQAAIKIKNITKGEHQMWPCGSDFQYQNADHWFHNLDKIIHYVNINAKAGGPVVAFYSTPSHYTDAKHAETVKNNAVWEVRSDDIFPLADNAHAYWTGYFTSRPSLKRQVRVATNFLNAARQMEVVSGVTAAEVDTPTERPSPPVGDSWTDSMEGAIGVATHHDGMSGTERQDVADDYSQRISEGHFEVEAGVALSLEKLSGIPAASIGHCNCNSAGNCLNISVCAYTTGVDAFTVIAWNPVAQKASSWLRLPVSGAAWSVTEIATKAAVPSQAIALDARTKSLPLLYLNKYKMNAKEEAAASAALANKATHTLTFEATLPPLGYSTFLVRKAAEPSSAALTTPTETSTVTNGVYTVTINKAAGAIESVKNIASGAEVALNISWGYYVSSEGGCTTLPDGTKSCSKQASGAYMFRPAEQFTHQCNGSSQPRLEVTAGPLVTEIKQVFADWATHVVRLTKGSPYIEVEWTAGPIPMGDPRHREGKEIVLKFNSNLASEGIWYTDSNGREMLKRKRDARGPSYPPYVIGEPVAGNYYPVNSLISLDDGKTEMAVAVDTTMGGASMEDGTLEVMVHRRCQKDDSRGVQEPLNETMCGCNDIGAKPGSMGKNGHEGDGGCDCQGLTMRGSTWLIIDTVENAHATRRQLVEGLNFPPTLAFSKSPVTAIKTPSMSTIAAELPANIKLMTISNNYAAWNEGKLILRLSHKYMVDEHPTLSQPVTFSLATVFAKAGLKVTSASETMLTANQPRATFEASKKVWTTEDPSGAMYKSEQPQDVRTPFDENDSAMSVTMRAMEVKTFLVTVV